MGRLFTRQQHRDSGRVVRFLRSAQGTSSVEQALFVALVIGAALAAVEGLGIVGHSTFFTVAQGMNGEAEGSREGSTTNSADVRDPRGGASVAAGDDLVLPSRFLLLLIACPFGAACWYLLYRDSRKRRREPDQAVETESPSTAVEQDSVFLKRHDLLRTFSGDVGIFFTSRMRIRQLMTRTVIQVPPNEPIAEVRRLMVEKRIRHLIVCDKQAHLLGVISDRDVHTPTARWAKDVMATDPVSVEPESLVNPAVTLLLQKRISCLPVVDRGCVVGVVTTSDLLMALQCTLHALQRAGAEAVADLPPDTVPGFMLAALQQSGEAQPSESSLAVPS
jgi:CBS domain-containing protein